MSWSGVGDQTQLSRVRHGRVGGQDPHGVAEGTGPGCTRSPSKLYRPPSYDSEKANGAVSISRSSSDTETRPCTTCTSTSSGARSPRDTKARTCRTSPTCGESETPEDST